VSAREYRDRGSQEHKKYLLLEIVRACVCECEAIRYLMISNKLID